MSVIRTVSGDCIPSREIVRFWSAKQDGEEGVMICTRDEKTYFTCDTTVENAFYPVLPAQPGWHAIEIYSDGSTTEFDIIGWRVELDFVEPIYLDSKANGSTTVVRGPNGAITSDNGLRSFNNLSEAISSHLRWAKFRREINAA